MIVEPIIIRITGSIHAFTTFFSETLKLTFLRLIYLSDSDSILLIQLIRFDHILLCVTFNTFYTMTTKSDCSNLNWINWNLLFCLWLKLLNANNKAHLTDLLELKSIKFSISLAKVEGSSELTLFIIKKVFTLGSCLLDLKNQITSSNVKEWRPPVTPVSQSVVLITQSLQYTTSYYFT